MSTAPTVELDKDQRTAVEHVARHPYAGVLCDPGFGKTVVTYSAFYLLRRAKMAKKLIVVAPINPMATTWPAEKDKWSFPFRVEVLHGSKKGEALERDADVYVVNYDGLPWLIGCGGLKDLIDRGADWFVADESVHLKHTQTQRYKILKPWIPSFRRRTILTGDPVAQSLIDLFGQMYVVDLGKRLGRYISHYRVNFFYPTGYGGYSWIPQENGEARIHAAIKDVCIRFDSEPAGIKEPKLIDVPVDLPPKAMARYQELEREFLLLVEAGAVTASNAGVLSSKLRQVANGAVYFENGEWTEIHDAKTTALRDRVAELSGQPIFVAYHFKHDLERLRSKDCLGDVPHIGGGVSRKVRTELMAEFNRGTIPVLLAQSGSSSEGVNLQEACHHVGWFGPTFNLYHYRQFNRRVHRRGQKKRVTIHRFIARNTIEERVLQVMDFKKATQDRLFAALKTYARSIR